MEVVYFTPGPNWSDKGRLKIALPALDLPISRTGLQVYYPPQFRFSAEQGSFRVENYSNPISTVLTAGIAEPAVDTSLAITADRISAVGSAAPSPLGNEGGGTAQRKSETKQSAQSLVDKFHADERGSRATGILPVRINFPALPPPDDSRCPCFLVGPPPRSDVGMTTGCAAAVDNSWQ